MTQLPEEFGGGGGPRSPITNAIVLEERAWGDATLAIAAFAPAAFAFSIAVLDTQFWLATHVVCITLGYAATFVAGAIAVIYVLAGALTRLIDARTRKDLVRMIYGIICFAMFHNIAD